MKTKFFIVVLVLLLFVACSQGDDKNNDTAKDIVDSSDVFSDIKTDSSADISPDTFHDFTEAEKIEPPDIKDIHEEFAPDEKDSGTDIKKDEETDTKNSASINCTSDEDCTISCGTGKCDTTQGKCTFTPKPGKCILPVDDQTVSCFDRGDKNEDKPFLFCNPKVSQDKWSGWYFLINFEKDEDEVQVKDYTGSQIVWHKSSKRAAKGEYSLYLGNEQTSSYKSEKEVKSSFTFSVNLPQNNKLFLEFDLWMATEMTENFDFLTVEVYKKGEQDKKELLFNSNDIKGTTHGIWQKMSFDVSSYANSETVFLFIFDTVDEKMNNFEGVYIDDIRITAGSCNLNIECDDLNPCTVTECDFEKNKCKSEKKENCCATDFDCDDFNVCSVDKCSEPGGECTHEFLEDCCNSDADCDDGNDCTEDLCPTPGLSCKHKVLCCEKDSDCNDENECTKDVCNEENKCEYIPICCTSDSDCDDGDICTKDVCNPDGNCEHKPAYIPGCCYPDLLTETFDNPASFLFQISETDGVGWHWVSGKKSTSNPGSLYYGDPTKDTYYTGQSNSGSVFSNEILLPYNVEITLEFEMWIDFDSWDDEFIVYIVKGEKEFKVWEADYNTTKKQFIHKKIDISSFAGDPIQIEFYFSTEPSWWGSSEHEGVYIDDVKIKTTCAPKSCNYKSDCKVYDSCTGAKCKNGVCSFSYICCDSDEDCDDGDVCTEDSCENQKCKNVYIEECCTTDADCDDKNPCTVDKCPGKGEFCTHEKIEGCCVKNSDCDDGNICTLDKCTEEHECNHTDICCETDEDCDDGDDVCTIDKCVDNFCKFEPTYAEGCCKPDVFTMDVESGDLSNVEMDPPMNGVGWQIVNDKKYTSPTHSFYYGNPETNNFDSGSANKGKLTIKNIALEPNIDLTLSFSLYMDTESSSSYDKLTVSIIYEGNSYKVWDKSSLKDTKEFFTYSVDITAFAGKTIDLEFFFDSKDSIANSGEGVYLDDIMITSNCAAKTCTSDSECSDGLSFTTDKCDNGTCSYKF